MAHPLSDEVRSVEDSLGGSLNIEPQVVCAAVLASQVGKVGLSPSRRANRIPGWKPSKILLSRTYILGGRLPSAWSYVEAENQREK